MMRKNTFDQCMRDESGATAIEYGLILSLIFVAMMAAVGAVADSTIGMWNNVSTKVETSTNP